jgi:signal transduction histidine kinase
MADQTDQLRRTIDALLDFSRFQSTRPDAVIAPVPLQELLDPLVLAIDADLVPGGWSSSTAVLVDAGLVRHAVELLVAGTGVVEAAPQLDVSESAGFVELIVRADTEASAAPALVRSLAAQLLVAAGAELDGTPPRRSSDCPWWARRWRREPAATSPPSATPGSPSPGASPTARSLENPVVKVAIAAPSVAALVYGVWTARIADLELFVALVVAAMVLATVAVAAAVAGGAGGAAGARLADALGHRGGGDGRPAADRGAGDGRRAVLAAVRPRRRRRCLLVPRPAPYAAQRVAPAGLGRHPLVGRDRRPGAADPAPRRRAADPRDVGPDRGRALGRDRGRGRGPHRGRAARPPALERAADQLAASGGRARRRGRRARAGRVRCVAIREHDVEAGTLRLVVGSPGMQELGLPPELPVERGGLSGLALRSGRPVVVDDYANHPAAIEPERPLQGVIAVPVEGDGGVRAVVLGARRDGAISAVQREAILLLSEQAGRALARASAFEEDRLTVADLRTLEVRTQDFVSTVSHELRTPLTVIQGLGQTLTRRWDDLDEDRRADLLGRIDANAERLSVMVRSLLDTSALEEGRLDLRPERLALRPLVDRLLHRLATVTAAHPVEVRIDPRLEIVADAGLFEHIVENLLTNVAKHTPQGTRVELSAEACGDRVRIEMRDDGPGIDPGDLPHVLDRFFRGGAPTRRTTGGLGLGLALARQIVQAHGGDLEVDSSPGVGTTFRFEVAAATVSPGGPPSDGSPPARP